MFQEDAQIQAALPATIQISVLGRGETLGYRGISEIDVFEATEDAIDRLRHRPRPRDAQRRVDGRHRDVPARPRCIPDRWAAAIPAIGSGAAVRPLFPNLRNVPVRQLNGRLDNGALGPPSEEDAVTLDALGYDHKYWLGNDRGHEIPGYYGCVFANDRDSRRCATRTRTRSCTASTRPISRRTRRATSRSATTPRTGCPGSRCTARRRAR